MGGGNEPSALERSTAALARARAARSAGWERAMASASEAHVEASPDAGWLGAAGEGWDQKLAALAAVTKANRMK
jgi:hypothetical protein